MKNKTAVEVKHLTVMYKADTVLFDVSVSVPPGVLMAIVGPNGAGKTTFLKALVGLLKPFAGTVSFFGQSFTQQQKKIAYVPQRMSVDWDFPLSALEVVLMGCYKRVGWFARPNKQEREKAFFTLDQVGLLQFADRPIGQLSGGQQQRVFLARALMQEAEIYLMDEPFAGVDMQTEKTMMQLLQQLRTEGKTILVVYHDLYKVSEYFDWGLFLHGRVITSGPMDQLFVDQLTGKASKESSLHV